MGSKKEKKCERCGKKIKVIHKEIPSSHHKEQTKIVRDIFTDNTSRVMRRQLNAIESWKKIKSKVERIFCNKCVLLEGFSNLTKSK